MKKIERIEAPNAVEINVAAPHLKSKASLFSLLARELAATLLLCVAACFLNGTNYLFPMAIVLATTILGDFIFQAAGFNVSPRLDLSLFHQAALLSLFLPGQLPWFFYALITFVFVSFYRLFGGKAALVLQPVCLALIFLKSLGYEPSFALMNLGSIAAGGLIVAWVLIRFPKTLNQTQRLIMILAPALPLAFLHEMSFFAALIWSTAAGELIFDTALMPLAPKTRIKYFLVTFSCFVLFSSGIFYNEAMIVVGFATGFFSAWLEKQALRK